MIASAPDWNVTLPAAELRLGHNWGVMLTPDSVLVPWVRLDRSTGAIVWQKLQEPIGRPNYRIVGVAGDVIVAARTRDSDGPDGPTTAEIGAYGFRLDNGDLLWEPPSPPSGWLGRLRFRLSGAPWTAWQVTDDGVWCFDGTLLDPQTGTKIGQRAVSPADRKADWPMGSRLEVDGQLDLGTWGMLRGGTPEAPYGKRESIPTGPLRLFREDGDGKVLWTFDPKVAQYSSPYPLAVLSVAPPWLYLLYQHYEANQVGICTLDLTCGKIVQTMSLGKTLGKIAFDDAGFVVADRKGKRIAIRYFSKRSEA